MRTISFSRAGALVTTLALASMTPAGVMAQSSSPGPSSHATPDAALAAVALMNMVPLGVMQTCIPSSPSMDGQLAVARCTIGEDTVVYASFDDDASLSAAYDFIVSSAGIEGGTSCHEGPFEGPYQAADGSEAGRVACQVGDPGLLLVWTDVANLVFGLVGLGGDGGYPALHDNWLKVRLDAATTAPQSSPGPTTSAVPTSSVAPTSSVPTPARGSELRQWASSAAASSQYGASDWSASQATGEPNTATYGDHPTAWAPSNSDAGNQWLELSYAQPVIPTALHIWESDGSGFVTKVEAWDEASGKWLVLFHGKDPTPSKLKAFSPRLSAATTPTARIKLTIDTRVPDWNEVDAVELVGVVP